MSLADLREAVQPQSALMRRMLLTVSAVGAIIIGILAMHSLSTDSHHSASSGAISASASHHPDTTAASEANSPVVETTCGAGCELDPAMTIAECILALLIVLIVLAPPGSRQVWVRMLLGPIRIVPDGALADRRPPSLQLLAISRT